MPNKDEKGPDGKGPKTGNQMGKCEGANPSKGTGSGLGPCGCGLQRRLGNRFKRGN